MQLIDTHCHVHEAQYLERYGMSIDEVMDDAHKHGVAHCVCVGTDAHTSREAAQAAHRHDTISASLALHPHEAAEASGSELKREFAKLRTILEDRLLRQNVVAIGECGMDY